MSVIKKINDGGSISIIVEEGELKISASFGYIKLDKKRVSQLITELHQLLDKLE